MDITTKTLRLDAVVTGVNAAAYLAAASALDSVLGLSAGVLRGVGAFLAVYTVFVWTAGARRAPAVIALNLLWAADSLVVAALGWGSPTGVGRAWIVVQGVAVAGLAAVQWWAVRRERGLRDSGATASAAFATR